MSLILLLKINQGADTMRPLALLLECPLLYSRVSEVRNHHHCFQSVVSCTEGWSSQGDVLFIFGIFCYDSILSIHLAPFHLPFHGTSTWIPLWKLIFELSWNIFNLVAGADGNPALGWIHGQLNHLSLYFIFYSCASYREMGCMATCV